MSDAPTSAPQADGAKAEEKPPTPSERMIEALGPFSTHPRFLARRLRLVRRIALAPIVLVLGYFAWRVWGRLSALPSLELEAIIPSLLPLLKSIFAIAPAFVTAFACSTAFSFAGLLTLRASIAPHHAARAARPRLGWIGLLAGTLAILGICLAVAWVAQTPRLEASTRWWVVAGAMVPLYVLLAVLDWSERDLDDRETGRLWYTLRWVVLAPAGLATIALTLPSASGWIASKLFGLLGAATSLLGLSGVSNLLAALIERKLETIVTQLAGLFAALTVVMTLSFRIRALERRIAREIARQSGAGQVEGDGEGQDHKERRPRGCLGRLFRLTGIPFLLGLFGVGEKRPARSEDPPSAAAAVPPQPSQEWLASLQNQAAAEGLSIAFTWHPGEAADASDGSTSPRIADSKLAWLFNGLDPSSDQVALFDAFQHRWTEHLRTIEEARYGADKQSHADLLVEAEQGSGVDDAIAACAVFACVARGQRVLMLVEGRAEQDSVVDAMRERLQRFAFDTLYSVAPLRREAVAEWCPPDSDPRAQPRGSPPDIAVATLDDYESVFFAGAFASEPLRAFQRSLEVVVVPAVDRQLNEFAARNHLPFVVDKHRLVLRTEHRAMQLVLTVRPMGARPSSIDRATQAARVRASTARRALALRLFGGDGGLDTSADRSAPPGDQSHRDAHLVYLRPITQPAAPILEVTSSAEQAADARIWIGRRLAKTSRLGMLFPGERPRGADQGAAAASRLIAGTSTFSSDRSRLAGCRWILGTGSFDGAEADAASRLVAQVPGATLVLVTANPVQRTSAPKPPPPSFPVFPTPMSPGLFVSHLRSVATSLTPDVAIRREDFARFGLAWDEAYWRTLAASTHPQTLGQSWWLELDGELRDIVRGDHRVWPAAFLRCEGELGSYPVDVHAPLEASYCLVPQRQTLRIGRLPHAVDRRRFATWITTRGLELGRTDLAYFQPVLFQGSRQGFRALDLTTSSDGTVVLAEPRSSDGGDLVIPVRQTRFDVPSDARIGNPRALRALNAFLFAIQEAGTPCESEERVVALASVGERGREHERRTIVPIEFRMHVGVTVLAIGGHLPASHAEPVLRARYEGRWDTAITGKGTPRPRDVWHGLSRAITYAIGEVAPSLLRFANAYAFRPPRGQPGATVLLIEPAATQGTAIEALGTILDDTELRDRFLRAFERAAREGLRSPEAMRLDGDDAVGSTESIEELLTVLELLRCAPTQASEQDSPRAECGIATIEPHDRTLLLPRHEPSARVTPGVARDANHRWRDVNAVPREQWMQEGRESLRHSPEYGILNDLPEAVAREATASFGLHDSIDRSDADALRASCISLERAADGSYVVMADYEEMIRRSLPALETVALRLRDAAGAAGLATVREQAGFFASFVQSIEYVVDRDGDLADGRERLGVQMPAATLHARKGDCDSVSLLLVSLLRAARIARAGLVLIEEPDGGHMMVAIDCPAVAGDARIVLSDLRLVLVETTGPWQVGRISSEYEGRHVRFLGTGTG